MSKNGLRTENLSVGYGENILIRDISLQVEPGKILTLIGPNGAGKSTILKTLTRQLKAMGGGIFIGGSDMFSMKNEEIAKSLSMVMTDRVKTEWMTCREVVATGRYPYTGRMGILAEEDEREVDRALEAVDAAEVGGQDFMKVSDGQRQRVMLARALCQKADILVLDEPTSFLDLRYKIDIMSIIRRAATKSPLAVVMSLHELDLARKISDILVCVNDRKIQRVGPPEEIFRGSFVRELYGLRPGSYDPVTNAAELPPVKGEPKVFVLGGGGAGISTYYRLQRENIPFAAGILQENDIEFPTARMLAQELVSVPAFSPVSEEDIGRARELIDRCEACIGALKTFGPQNQLCAELEEYAKRSGKWQKRMEV